MAGTPVDRRKFLKSMAASGTVASLPGAVSASLTAETTVEHYSILTPAQASMMEAMVELLIPADDYPGAKEAGVVHFIDQKLAGPYGRFSHARYEKGLRLVDEVSRKQFGKPYNSLPSDDQSSVLHALADNSAGPEGHDFFHLLLGDTFAGYYGDPVHGGNRDRASWKMIGFEG